MKKLIALLLLVLSTVGVYAQGVQAEMEGTFRSSGKIYVVIAIIVIIFIGLAFYLFSMDRRLKKIEKNNRSEK